MRSAMQRTVSKRKIGESRTFQGLCDCINSKRPRCHIAHLIKIALALDRLRVSNTKYLDNLVKHTFVFKDFQIFLQPILKLSYTLGSFLLFEFMRARFQKNFLYLFKCKNSTSAFEEPP